MLQQEEITLQTLTDNEAINVGYFDNDIVVVDSIQKFAEVSAARVSMSAIAICTCGRVQGLMNGQQIELRQNQVAVIPANVMITDLMISPDFNLKALFFTTQILQSFLREKMSVWNEVMYIRRIHILILAEDDMLFYTHFYEMLRLCVERGKDRPFHTEIVQSLIRSAMLGLCGAMKMLLPDNPATFKTGNADNYFQRFLNLISQSEVKYRTVKSYADELCISPKYLSVICKKHSGKTANEWITEHVMEDIRYHLRQTDLSVKQVCDRLGFANPSFFGKYVKEHFGTTPTQLRLRA
ncbi:MAG: AraC family transcriptional regulator [Prevotella sp.]|nr:AraC family transcriptional regulator [Prevotella sp.]